MSSRKRHQAFAVLWFSTGPLHTTTYPPNSLQNLAGLRVAPFDPARAEQAARVVVDRLLAAA
jgi:hypothetical protein